MHEVLTAADERNLLSHEHFGVDGTLLEAWASHKSFRPMDAQSPPSSAGSTKNSAVDFRGEQRSNTTHQSVTDPDARLARKSHGTASILGHLGSVLMDNRDDLIVATDERAPNYDAERDAAVAMLTRHAPRQHRRTVGTDKGYDSADVVTGARACGVTPDVAQNIHERKFTKVMHKRARHDMRALRTVK